MKFLVRYLFQQNCISLAYVNYVGMCYTLFLSCAALLVTSALYLPLLYSHSTTTFRALTLWTWFIFGNLVANYILMLVSAKKSVFQGSPLELCTSTQRNGSHNNILNTTFPNRDTYTHPNGQFRTCSNWKYCTVCDHYAPPRSRHCPFCQRCILRHDHHCLFTGCCIGLHNQRYFIVFCVYGWIGSFKAATLSLFYLNSVRGSSLYSYLPPNALFSLIFGDLEFSLFCIMLLLYLLFTTHLACTYFMFWQLLLLARGQTAYEYVKGITPFQTSFRHHVKSVFGPYWLVNFIIPMFWFSPSTAGSGLVWDNPQTKKIWLTTTNKRRILH